MHRPTCSSTYCLDGFDGKVVEEVPLGLGCVLNVRARQERQQGKMERLHTSFLIW